MFQKEIFVVRIGIFQANLPSRDKAFAEKQHIMHTIVSPLLFIYLNVSGIDIWERVKLGLPKEVS